MSQESVTLWIRALEEDDESAAQALFDRYFDRLVALARRKLGTSPRRVVDEEDVAITAFYACLAIVSSGRHPQVRDRNHLWRLLVRITENKVQDTLRRQLSAKRGAGNVRGESVFLQPRSDSREGSIDEIPDGEPTPEFADCLAKKCQKLLGLLEDDNLREVAQLVLAGHSTAEIAKLTDRTQRTVQRRIKMIQDVWKCEEPS